MRSSFSSSSSTRLFFPYSPSLVSSSSSFPPLSSSSSFPISSSYSSPIPIPLLPSPTSPLFLLFPYPSPLFLLFPYPTLLPPLPLPHPSSSSSPNPFDSPPPLPPPARGRLERNVQLIHSERRIMRKISTARKYTLDLIKMITLLINRCGEAIPVGPLIKVIQ